MSSMVLTGLVIVLAIGWALFVRKQQRTIAQLKHAREELQLEESRVFDFLHGLGAASSGDLHPSELHRLIVGGAMRIVDAHAGPLFLSDRTGKMLLPPFLPPGCPPLVGPPKSTPTKSVTTPAAIDS